MPLLTIVISNRVRRHSGLLLVLGIRGAQSGKRFIGVDFLEQLRLKPLYFLQFFMFLHVNEVPVSRCRYRVSRQGGEQEAGRQVLLSAFYYGYVVCMPAMGYLAERFGAKRVLAAGVTVCSVATLATGFAGSFVTLLALRVLLGVGESVAFPCASKVLAHAVDVSRLGVANGILSSAICWDQPSARDSEPSFTQILKRRELWGASLGHFSSNYGYYFIVSWMPFYLIKSRGFTMGSMVGSCWAGLPPFSGLRPRAQSSRRNSGP